MLKRNLLTSILLYESVRTTRARAKAVQPMVDKLINVAKKKSPQLAIRAINKHVTDKNASRKIMEVYVKRYADRSSGLTRIEPLGARLGDGAKLVQFSLIDAVTGTDAELPKKEKAKEAKPKTKTAAKDAVGAKKTAKKATKTKVKA
jgi:large subunit ribosomal protein L17